MNFKFLRTLINMLVEDEMKHAIIEIFYRKIIWISFGLTSEGVSVKDIRISFDSFFFFQNYILKRDVSFPLYVLIIILNSLSLSSFIFGNICLSLHPLHMIF